MTKRSKQLKHKQNNRPCRRLCQRGRRFCRRSRAFPEDHSDLSALRIAAVLSRSPCPISCASAAAILSLRARKSGPGYAVRSTKKHLPVLRTDAFGGEFIPFFALFFAKAVPNKEITLTGSNACFSHCLPAGVRLIPRVCAARPIRLSKGHGEPRITMFPRVSASSGSPIRRAGRAALPPLRVPSGQLRGRRN